MDKYIIVGANGFIGSYLSKDLTTKAQVQNITRDEVDLSQSHYRCISKNDHIIYCAGIPRSKKDDQLTKELNLTILRNTLESFKEPKSFTFMSSVEIYGIKHSEVINEETSFNPHNYYSEGKIIAEEMIHSFYKGSGDTCINILRLPGVYSKDSSLGLMGAIRNSINKNQTFILNNNGQDQRDFLYLPDLSTMTYELIHQGKNQTLNIATGFSTTTKNMCDLIYEHNRRFSFKLNENIESVSNLHFDIRKLKESLPNIHPRTIQEGLKDLNYYL